MQNIIIHTFFFIITSVMQLSEPQISYLLQRLQEIETRVAFFAGLKLNIVDKPPEVDPRIIMNQVVTNIGNAYDATRGEFVAPVSGVYVLVVAISAQGKARAAVRLMHNKKSVVDVWSESSPWSTATNQAVLEMSKGDTVWLIARDDAYFLHGYMYSTFSGYLLYPTDRLEYPDKN